MSTKVASKGKRTSKRRTKKPKRAAVRMLRTSERSSFRRCRQQWQWGYEEGLKAVDEAPALRFGSLVHAALEQRYPPGIKRGPKPAEVFEKLYHEELKEHERNFGFRDADDDEWTNALDIGVDMLEAFVEQYGRDEDWQVIASELTFQTPVYPPDWMFVEGDRTQPLPNLGDPDPDKPLFYYVGTVDGVWRNRMDGGVRIIDWKTTKSDPTKMSHLILDEQATAYWTWGVDALIDRKILKPKDQEALDGMVYTFLRKAKRDERPQDAQGHYLNKDGTVSKRQPPPMFHREMIYRGETDRERARERAVNDFLEMESIRRGELRVVKTPSSAPPMNHCSFCPFNDMCELHEVGADWEGLKKLGFKKWDPYSAHEIAEEGKR